MPFEAMDDTLEQHPKIKVIGVGGGGGNAVDHMVNSSVEGVDFISANTDAQALKRSLSRTVLQLGNGITRGLGAGANPEVGRQSAIEDRERIQSALEGTDMLFITVGMGGGTGTGAAPIVAQIARDLEILTVAVVTKPFPFEGKLRMKIAEEGINELKQYVDSLIIIPNEKLAKVLGRDMSIMNAFAAANNVLLGAVQGIAELITQPGYINVDFADVRAVMKEMGMGMMGTGVASGENRAPAAAEAAISSPLLEDVSLQGARGILVSITHGPDMGIGELEDIGDLIRERAAEGGGSDNARVVVGTVYDTEMSDEVRVTVVATGLDASEVKKDPPKLEVVKPQPRVVNGDVNYDDYERRPAIARNPVAESVEKGRVSTGSGRGEGRGSDTAGSAGGNNMDYLDIPAFLRRQAD